VNDPQWVSLVERWSVEMNGDDLIIERDQRDGEWVKTDDVRADLAELAQFRAMVSSPEICALEIERLRAALAAAEALLTANGYRAHRGG
jgi:hypothetical protein